MFSSFMFGVFRTASQKFAWCVFCYYHSNFVSSQSSECKLRHGAEEWREARMTWLCAWLQYFLIFKRYKLTDPQLQPKCFIPQWHRTQHRKGAEKVLYISRSIQKNTGWIFTKVWQWDGEWATEEPVKYWCEIQIKGQIQEIQFEREGHSGSWCPSEL